MIKPLNFSNKFFSVKYVKEEEVTLTNISTVINLSDIPIKIDFVGDIKKDKSFLLTPNIGEIDVKEGLIIEYSFNPQESNSELQNFCIKTWDNNKIRYPEDPTKWNYPILRSPIEKFDNYEFNCWYLPGHTASSIHQEHPFTEVHTQVYGLGIMNKYKENDKDSLYQKMYMPIGFTHDYFYDKDNKYPWHQYEAVSESIWLAIMRY